MSKREVILTALFTKLSKLQDVTVRRNDPLPQKIPEAGLVTLRDGVITEAETILSPPRIIFAHKVEIEVLVQKATPADRDTALDNLLDNIDRLLVSDTSLSGLIDYMYSEPPEFIEEVTDGSIPIKAATVHIVLEYTSD